MVRRHLEHLVNWERENAREQALHFAELAFQSGLYDDVLFFCQSIVCHATSELSQRERNLLAIAFKYRTEPLLVSWRRLSEIRELHRDEGAKGDANASEHQTHTQRFACATQYRHLAESDVLCVCRDVTTLVLTHLLPLSHSRISAATSKLLDAIPKEATVSEIRDIVDEQLESAYALGTNLSPLAAENTVFYLKMLADYIRFAAELGSTEEEDTLSSQRSLAVYLMAVRLAAQHLKPHNPIRLALLNNLATLYYDVLEQPQRACRVAETAFDEAVAAVDRDQESVEGRDVQHIMTAIRDNLKKWSASLE